MVVFLFVAGQQSTKLSFNSRQWRYKLTGAILGACVTIFETSAASGIESREVRGRGEAGGDEAAAATAARGGGVDVGEELPLEDVIPAAAAVAVIVAAVGGSTGLSDRGWLEAVAAASSASSSKLAVALAGPGDAGVDMGVGVGVNVDVVVVVVVVDVIGGVLVRAAVGVLGLLLPLPLLFCRMRSTSDGRAFNVGRGCKPSIQDKATQAGTVPNNRMAVKMRAKSGIGLLLPTPKALDTETYYTLVPGRTAVACIDVFG
jgi:hypothetical protein